MRGHLDAGEAPLAAVHSGILDVVSPGAKYRGDFLDMKIDFLGCIGVTRKQEYQSQNSYWAICPPAISLRVQSFREFLSDFGTFSVFAKMPSTSSKMDGFLILKILLVARMFESNVW